MLVFLGSGGDVGTDLFEGYPRSEASDAVGRGLWQKLMAKLKAKWGDSQVSLEEVVSGQLQSVADVTRPTDATTAIDVTKEKVSTQAPAHTVDDVTHVRSTQDGVLEEREAGALLTEESDDVTVTEAMVLLETTAREDGELKARRTLELN